MFFRTDSHAVLHAVIAVVYFSSCFGLDKPLTAGILSLVYAMLALVPK